MRGRPAPGGAEAFDDNPEIAYTSMTALSPELPVPSGSASQELVDLRKAVAIVIVVIIVLAVLFLRRR